MTAMMAPGTQAFKFQSSGMNYCTRSNVQAQTLSRVLETAVQTTKIKGRLATSKLQMADVPQGDEENAQLKKGIKRNEFRLPPPPEDQFTMTGDFIGLFIYGFTNHLICDVFLTKILDSSPSAEAAAKALDPNGDVIHAGAVPVWIDTSCTCLSEHVLRLGLQQRVLPTYAPILSTAGLATVSLAFCWLLAGYCLQSFSFRNTLDCSPHHAVQVTGKTWLLCSFFMLILVCLSRYYLEGSLAFMMLDPSQIGPVDATTNPTSILQTLMGTLTISDTDYIFDSLGVLLTWRVMISYLIGYGE